MNFVIIKRLFLGDYSSGLSSSEQLDNIGLFFTDIYPDSANQLRKKLRSNDEIYSGGNCTFLETKGTNALIGFEFRSPELDAVVNRYALADAIDCYHELIAKKVPFIYIFEENGNLSVTDKPTPEIEEYLKQHSD